jgi:hypothetical protein
LKLTKTRKRVFFWTSHDHQINHDQTNLQQSLNRRNGLTVVLGLALAGLKARSGHPRCARKKLANCEVDLLVAPARAETLISKFRVRKTSTRPTYTSYRSTRSIEGPLTRMSVFKGPSGPRATCKTARTKERHWENAVPDQFRIS